MNKVLTLAEKTIGFFSELIDTFFHPEQEKDKRWLVWLTLIIIFLLGIFLWGFFLDWGDIPFDFHDWMEVTAPRLVFVQNCINELQPPFHMPERAALSNLTDRYLSIPDTFATPQLLLLRFMEPGTYALVNIWLLYSVGFVGLLLIRRKFSLSLAAFSLLSLLFNFNGHIIAHIGIGHLSFAGYLLFPWFALLIFGLLDGKGNWLWVFKMSTLLLILFLQGSYHQLVWTFYFVFLAGLSSRKTILPAIKAILFTGLWSAIRILPVFLVVDKFDNAFYSGYLSVFDLIHNLIAWQQPGQVEPKSILLPHDLGYWEFTLYIGLAAALFLLYFGLIRWIGGLLDKNGQTKPFYAGLLLPISVMFMLSIGTMYKPLHMLPIPLVNGERVATRFFVIPLVFLIIIACTEFQRWLNRTRPAPILKLTQLGIIGLILHDLWQNIKLWQVDYTFQQFIPDVFHPERWYVANHPDIEYKSLLLYGAIISVISFLLLSFLVWREYKKTTKSIPENIEKTV